MISSPTQKIHLSVMFHTMFQLEIMNPLLEKIKQNIKELSK
jgi:hypothetical protein